MTALAGRRPGAETAALAGGAGITAFGMGLLAPILPGYAESLGASATLIGLLLAGFGVTRLLVGLPSAWLARRWGRRGLLIGSPAVTAPVAALCAAAGGFWALAAFCLVEGAAAAVYATVGTAAVAGDLRPKRRGRSLAVYQAAGLLGAALGPAIGGLLGQRFGPRAPFLLYGALAAAVAWWLHRTLGEQVPRSAGGQPPDAPPAESGELRRLLTPGLVSLWGLSFALVFARVGALLIGVPLLGAWRLRLAADQIGLALSLSALAALVAFYPGGWLADRYGRRLAAVGGGLGMVLALALLAGSRDFGGFLLAAGLLGVAGGLVGPAPTSYLADILPDRERDAGVALYRTFGDAGAAVAPPVLGWLADRGGGGAALLAAAAVLLLGTLGFAGQAPAAARPTDARPGPERPTGD